MIAVDIDSTLYDFSTPCRQAFLDLALEHGDKEEYFKGGYMSWPEWRSPADVCGIDAFLETLDIVHSDEVIKAQLPFTHSEEVVQDIAREHEIFYISARKEESQDATEEWLFEICDYPEARVVCTMEDKIPYVAECQYIIDDRCKTIVDFVYDFTWKYTYGSLEGADNQRKAFGLLYEYNRNLTDIPNVYLAPTWAGIRYYLERKGVLNGARSDNRVAA